MTSVLVVDDDPVVCFALARFFRAEGWDVAFAQTLGEALEQVQMRRPMFDVVVTDLNLGPKAPRGGFALVRICTAVSIPVVLVSGDLKRVQTDPEFAPPALFLEKPFHPTALKAVKELLCSSSSRPTS